MRLQIERCTLRCQDCREEIEVPMRIKLADEPITSANSKSYGLAGRPDGHSDHCHKAANGCQPAHLHQPAAE